MSEKKSTQASKRTDTKQRIVRATAELLAQGGREGVTTRAVATRAEVQAPTIYRLFGDMRGLLDEVVAYGFTTYLDEKTSREKVEDPVDALRRGWDLHIGFGLANPEFYKLMYGDPKPGAVPKAAREADEILREHVERIAVSGRLRVSAERASEMIRAAGTGLILTLVAEEPEDRDPALSGAVRDAIFAAITTDYGEERTPGAERRESVINRAVALKAVLSEEEPERLTPGEMTLLSEWLDRLARSDD